MTYAKWTNSPLPIHTIQDLAPYGPWPIPYLSIAEDRNQRSPSFNGQPDESKPVPQENNLLNTGDGTRVSGT